MFRMGPDQVGERPGVAFDEEVPVVTQEPEVGAQREHHERQGHRHVGPERPGGQPVAQADPSIPGWPSRGPRICAGRVAGGRCGKRRGRCGRPGPRSSALSFTGNTWRTVASGLERGPPCRARAHHWARRAPPRGRVSSWRIRSIQSAPRLHRAEARRKPPSEVGSATGTAPGWRGLGRRGYFIAGGGVYRPMSAFWTPLAQRYVLAMGEEVPVAAIEVAADVHRGQLEHDAPVRQRLRPAALRVARRRRSRSLA